MKDFLMRNFDKLLLTFLVMFFSLLTAFVMWRGAAESTIDWAAGLVTLAIGSLTTLITGNYLKSSRNPDNETVITPPKKEGE